MNLFSFISFVAASFLALLSLLSGQHAAAVTQLNIDDYYQQTLGKTVFIKMFAPWCGHCKAMQEDWELLAKDYEGDENILIAEVDCTVDGGKELCDELGAEGYPTIRYGDPYELNDYYEERDYKNLSSWAQKTLKPRCSYEKQEFCTEKQKPMVREIAHMTLDELESRLESIEAILEKEETRFNEVEAELQKQLDSLDVEFKKKKKEIEQDGLFKLMKQTRDYLQKQSVKNDEL